MANENAKAIYEILIAGGLSRAGALGVLGTKAKGEQGGNRRNGTPTV